MKKLFLILHFITFWLCSKAQSNAFLYIESRNNQPFYLTIDSNRYQRHFSTLQIVPELLEGPLLVVVQLQNQPKEVFSFHLTMPAASHRSFLLDKNQENQWVLFDLERNYTLHANNELEEDQEQFNRYKQLRSK